MGCLGGWTPFVDFLLEELFPLVEFTTNHLLSLYVHSNSACTIMVMMLGERVPGGDLVGLDMWPTLQRRVSFRNDDMWATEGCGWPGLGAIDCLVLGGCVGEIKVSTEGLCPLQAAPASHGLFS